MPILHGYSQSDSLLIVLETSLFDVHLDKGPEKTYQKKECEMRIPKIDFEGLFFIQIIFLGG